MATAEARRMDLGDCAVIYARQSLEAMGDIRVPPSGWLDLVTRFPDRRSIIDEAWDAASELFGACPHDEAGHQLFQVKDLTLKESIIAARLDLTHDEKVELIRPLREKRVATAEARMERCKPTKWEREYLENRERRKEEREEGIVATAAESRTVSEEDRSWASQMGIRLD